MKSNAGFTLVETMVAALIAFLVLAAVLAIQMMSAHTFAEGSADAMLERTGNMIMERIVRGPAGQYGLREARFGTVVVSGGPTPHIAYMVDRNNPPTFDTSDDTACAIYLDASNTIIYDPDTSVEDDEIELNAEPVIHQMTVIQHADTIEIELVLQQIVQPFESAMQVRISTSISPRVQ